MRPNVDGLNPIGSSSDVDSSEIEIRKLLEPAITALEENQSQCDYYPNPQWGSLSPDDWLGNSSAVPYYIESLLDFKEEDLGGNSSQKLRYGDPKRQLKKSVRRRFAGWYMTNGLLCKTLAVKLSEKPLDELLSYESVWRCVEDQILVSSPEEFVLSEGREWIRKMFRYCIALLLYSNKDVFLKVHKRNLLYFNRVGSRIRNYKAAQSNGYTGENYDVSACLDSPIGFPGWDNVTRTLVSGPGWLQRIMYANSVKCTDPEKHIATKGDITRLAQLTSCSGFPPPGAIAQGQAILDHRKTLTQVRAPTAERLQVVRRLARGVGMRIKVGHAVQVLQNSEHLSLTNRSSMDSTRDLGGRAVEVATHWREAAPTYLDLDSIMSPMDRLKNYYEADLAEAESLRIWKGKWTQEHDPMYPEKVYYSNSEPMKTFKLHKDVDSMIEDLYVEQGTQNPALQNVFVDDDFTVLTQFWAFMVGLSPTGARKIDWADLVDNGFIIDDYVYLEFEWWSGKWNFVHAAEPFWRRVGTRHLRRGEEDITEFEQEYESLLSGTRVSGFNGNAGVQILNLALDSLASKGSIDPKFCWNPLTNQFWIEGQTDHRSDNWGSRMRTSIKPETGGKSRIFTIQEWDRTIALQPFGHFFVDCLKSLPEARAGLSKENAGWEWGRDLGKNAHIPTELLRTFKIMTNDLNTATDYGDFLIGKALVQGTLNGIGDGARQHGHDVQNFWDVPYLRTATNILCSGVMMETIGKKTKR